MDPGPGQERAGALTSSPRPERRPEAAGTPPPTPLLIGPIPGLVELRLLEEALRRLHGVAGVQVLWFGRRWARMDVAAASLEGALPALGRPLKLDVGPGGVVTARFADLVGPPEPAPSAAATGARRPSPGPEPLEPTGGGLIDLVPEPVCRHFRILPVAVEDARLTVAMADPEDRLARDVAAALSGREVRVLPAAPERLAAAIERAFGSPADRPAEPRRPPPGAGDRSGVPEIDLEGLEPAMDALAIVPAELQRAARCLPLELDDRYLYVAVGDPLDAATAARLEELAGGRRVRTFIADRDELGALIERGPLLRPPQLISAPPTAFPGARGHRSRRRLRTVPVAVWRFLRAPVPVGAVLVALAVAAALAYFFA